MPLPYLRANSIFLLPASNSGALGRDILQNEYFSVNENRGGFRGESSLLAKESGRHLRCKVPAHGLQVVPGHPLHFYWLLCLVSWRRPPPVEAIFTRFSSSTEGTVLLSPNGAPGNSQGRKSLESGTPGEEPCKGGTERKDFGVSPFRAPRQNCSITRGLRPCRVDGVLPEDL